MLEEMVKFFLSGFIYPDITLFGLLWGILLGIIFGAIWLTGYWPPLFKRGWLWAVMAGSAFLSWAAVSFIQIPLQALVGQILLFFWGEQTIMQWILLAGIPQILLSGFVQEGSKLVPMAIYWDRTGRIADPKMGLVVGAVAGAGLGIFEAVWVHNTLFASGWTLAQVQTVGFMALTPFWERFFTVAFHIGVSALAGYGLYKGRVWQFYVLAALLHSLLNYGVVLLNAGIIDMLMIELYVAAIAIAITGVALRLRWKKLRLNSDNPFLTRE